MIIEIDGSKTEITDACKVSKQVRCENRADYERIFGIRVKIGERGLFKYPSYIKYWFSSKEERDVVFDKVY